MPRSSPLKWLEPWTQRRRPVLRPNYFDSYPVCRPAGRVGLGIVARLEETADAITQEERPEDKTSGEWERGEAEDGRNRRRRSRSTKYEDLRDEPLEEAARLAAPKSNAGIYLRGASTAERWVVHRPHFTMKAS
jgi:hypothetical protein